MNSVFWSAIRYSLDVNNDDLFWEYHIVGVYTEQKKAFLETQRAAGISNSLIGPWKTEDTNTYTMEISKDIAGLEQDIPNATLIVKKITLDESCIPGAFVIEMSENA